MRAQLDIGVCLAGRPMVEEEEFLAMLGEVVSGIDSGERLLVCGDLKGQF